MELFPIIQNILQILMRRSRKFSQSGYKFDVFIVDESREDPNTSLSVPSSTPQLKNGVLLGNGGPTLNAGLVAL